MNEHKIDNRKGAGATPNNADVDYFGLRVKMKPSTFLKLAAPLGMEHSKDLEKYIADGGAIGAPFLTVDIPAEWNEGDFSKPAAVRNHEGRNRMSAILKLEGDVPVEVHIFPRGGYRARDLTKDWIASMKSGLVAEKSTKYVSGPLFEIESTNEAFKPMVTLHTDPDYFGATVDDRHNQKRLLLRKLPVDLIDVYEPEDKMKSLSSRMNVSRLIKSIKAGEKLPPILVRKSGKRYQVLDGHHRLYAHKKLDLKTILCRIVPERDIEVVENDAEHAGELVRTGFWGKQGAGCIIMARDTGRICLPLRSEHVQEPNTWGTWGGAIDGDEDPTVAAKREVQEEAGYNGSVKMVPLLLFKHPSGFRYFNFLALVDHEFKPQLNWETQTYDWVKFGEWPSPLHPGLKSLISDSASMQTVKEYADVADRIDEDMIERKLVIFDIDDTLVHTDTKVHVIKDGETVAELNSHEFTHYKLKPGEEFDFGRFRDAREFFEKSRPNLTMINQLKRDIETGNKVVMVTAREDFNDREIFLNTFRRFGIDMNRVHVYRAGNIKSKIATQDKKKIIIRQLLDNDDYSKAIMYDDAVPNLTAFISLKKEYPDVKFYAWHVSMDGDAHEYERADETLQEAATPILFHYTSVYSALKMFVTGKIKFSSVLGNNTESQIAPKGYPYFLSLTRSKVGDYHRWVGSSAVMLVIDGDWLNQHGYKTKAVDYWERSWLYPGSNRTRESEDRVFSRESSMPIDPVREVHVLIKEVDELGARGQWTRRLLIRLKKLNIPVYLYDNSSAWRLQDKRRTVSVKQAFAYLRGSTEPSKSFRLDFRPNLKLWLELLYHNSEKQLSPLADKLRYNLIYRYYPGQRHESFENELANNRKPNQPEYEYVVKINDYMRRHKISNLADFVDRLRDKWEKIRNKTKNIKEANIKLRGYDNDNISAFIKEYTEQTQDHPYSKTERIYNNQVTIELSPFDGKIHLSDIRSLAPGSGAGTKALKFLTGLAKKHGVTIEAIAKVYHPDKKYIRSSSRLKDWYLKHGFRLEPDTFGDDEQGYNIEYIPESTTLSYIGNCTNDDVIEHLFGDATGFAQLVDKHGDEFTIDDLVVKYDPDSDIHSFYYKTNKTELEEGWREKALGAAGAVAMAAGMSKLPAPDIHKDQPTAQVQMQQPAQTQPAAPAAPTVKKPVKVQLQTNHEDEKLLYSIAATEGLRGEELAQFLAQCKHESFDFNHMRELGSVKKLSAAYAKKKSLGNRGQRDAARFIGRGPLQITGRENYRNASRYLFSKFESEDPEFLEALPGGDSPDFLLKHPELMANPVIGSHAAVYYWKSRVRPNVNNFNDTTEVTKQINPDLRGLDKRQAYFQAYRGNQG